MSGRQQVMGAAGITNFPFSCVYLEQIYVLNIYLNFKSHVNGVKVGKLFLKQDIFFRILKVRFFKNQYIQFLKIKFF